jgi:hypothetical protein
MYPAAAPKYKDGISQATWMSIGTRNGGEVVSSDSY